MAVKAFVELPCSVQMLDFLPQSTHTQPVESLNWCVRLCVGAVLTVDLPPSMILVDYIGSGLIFASWVVLAVGSSRTSKVQRSELSQTLTLQVTVKLIKPLNQHLFTLEINPLHFIGKQGSILTEMSQSEQFSHHFSAALNSFRNHADECLTYSGCESFAEIRKSSCSRLYIYPLLMFPKVPAFQLFSR